MSSSRNIHVADLTTPRACFNGQNLHIVQECHMRSCPQPWQLCCKDSPCVFYYGVSPNRNPCTSFYKEISPLDLHSPLQCHCQGHRHCGHTGDITQFSRNEKPCRVHVIAFPAWPYTQEIPPVWYSLPWPNMHSSWHIDCHGPHCHAFYITPFVAVPHSVCMPRWAVLTVMEPNTVAQCHAFIGHAQVGPFNMNLSALQGTHSLR